MLAFFSVEKMQDNLKSMTERARAGKDIVLSNEFDDADIPMEAGYYICPKSLIEFQILSDESKHQHKLPLSRKSSIKPQPREKRKLSLLVDRVRNFIVNTNQTPEDIKDLKIMKKIDRDCKIGEVKSKKKKIEILES